MQDGEALLFPSLLESQSLPSFEDLPVSLGCERRKEATELRAVEEKDDLKNSESANCVIPHQYASTARSETSRCFHPLNQALKIRPLSSLTLKPADPKDI